MIEDVDKQAILGSYATTLAAVDQGAELGRTWGRAIDRIMLVGCGGPNRAMLAVEYWIEHFSDTLEVRRYFPAEFMALNPRRLDSRTLVVFGSRSGTTPEIVGASKWITRLPCKVLAITERTESQLAKNVSDTLLTGPSSGGGSLFMLLVAFIGGVLAEKDQWTLFEPLMSSLRVLPEVMASVAAANDGRSAEDARLLRDDRILYEVASGPMFSAAYIWGVCVLMEMQWMHSVPLEAAEFFHGPFEVIDQDTPIVLLKGEDPSRPLVDRVERFCKKYTERLFVYDTLDYEMPGVATSIRPIVGPSILQYALRRISERLAVWHNHPLATRRYMGKTDY